MLFRSPVVLQRARASFPERTLLAIPPLAVLHSDLRRVHPDRAAGDAQSCTGSSLMTLFSRTPRAPLEYSRTLWMRLWVGTVMLFLYAPLIILVIFSFNDSKRNVVWRGFTTKYYEKALGNDQLVEALLNSLKIGRAPWRERV